MYSLLQPILRTDISGMPLEWIHYQTAIKLHLNQQVAYVVGTPIMTIRGGTNRKTGIQSKIELTSIMSTYGSQQSFYNRYIPPLNNPTLFKRDADTCLYCGNIFSHKDLSRDHIIPVVRGGHDCWTNVITACKRCNNIKGRRTPEEANMPLLAVPFQPTYAEYVYLKGRHILADQMEFLSAHFPKSSPLLSRQ